MKIKRFVARDMRQAIRMVREALGEDAVILSNKTVDGGVELTAAIDLNPEDHLAPAEKAVASAESHASSQAASMAPPVQTDTLDGMRQEMQDLRRWMQAELSSMSWHDLGQRSPHSQELLRRMMTLGLSADLAKSLTERVATLDNKELAWKKALYFLAGEINIVEDEILERGGVVALVGPTGVGKTTSIAKMAARYALRNGHRNVALVTTDGFRIGARDQLHTYGRILNVPVRSAADPDEMLDVITSLSDRRLVLVDTAGMGADNERFNLQLETLAAVGPSLTTLLTLSATTEGAALEKAVRLFSIAKPSACILTKLDEAGSLGSALSAVIRSGLPLSFIADGQRVPEDLHIARSLDLVTRAEALLAEHPSYCDQAYMALSYGAGESAHA